MVNVGVDDNMDNYCRLCRTSSKLRRQHRSKFEFFDDNLDCNLNILTIAVIDSLSHVLVKILSHVFVEAWIDNVELVNPGCLGSVMIARI